MNYPDPGSNNDPLPFSPPLIPQDAIEKVMDVLRSGWIGTGPLVQDFERKFASFVGASYSAAVSSCTSGLFLSLKALGVGPGDEVITTAMTFCSTVNAILHTGARPIIVDIDPKTGNLDLEQIEGSFSSRTKAVLPVHYTGRPVDMRELVAICQERRIAVIEDCAHAVEASIDGKKTGTFGDAGVYSFYATKNLAIGEGGMVVGNNGALVDRVAGLSLHGLSRGAWSRFSVSGRKTYEVNEIGYKANMTDVQAAIGLAQLEALEANYDRRVAIWNYYLRELADCNVVLPSLPCDGWRHALHLFVIQLPASIALGDGAGRDSLVQRVADSTNVSLGIHYRAIPDFPIYQHSLEIERSQFPAAVAWGQRCVSLGLSPRLSDLQVERTVQAVKEELL